MWIPKSRHMHKSRSEYRDGYKAHVAVEPDTGIITGTALTPANAGDGPTGVTLLDNEPPGREVYADSAYGGGDTRAEIRRRGHDSLIKPLPLRRHIPDGFIRDDFTIDHHARTATCPAGHTVAITSGGGADFGAHCTGCPLRRAAPEPKTDDTSRSQRTTPSSIYARHAWTDPIFQTHYRQHRPMVERASCGSSPTATARALPRHRTQQRVARHPRRCLNLRRLVNLGADPTAPLGAHLDNRHRRPRHRTETRPTPPRHDAAAHALSTLTGPDHVRSHTNAPPRRHLLLQQSSSSSTLSGTSRMLRSRRLARVMGARCGRPWRRMR